MLRPHMVGATGFEPATTPRALTRAQAGSSDVTRSQAVETTATHCTEHTAHAAPSAAGVTGFGEPVVIPLDQLLDAAFEAEAWALDARLARAESAEKASADCGQGIDGLR